MIALTTAAILISVVSKKVHGGFFYSIRNTVVGYVALGTVLVPEVFNPFLY